MQQHTLRSRGFFLHRSDGKKALGSDGGALKILESFLMDLFFLALRLSASRPMKLDRRTLLHFSLRDEPAAGGRRGCCPIGSRHAYQRQTDCCPGGYLRVTKKFESLFLSSGRQISPTQYQVSGE